ncbi:hypothetical protein J2129_001339 [Methanofollis sp. W23]|nr:hypothetical protein [Methanofollis sp. W23]
MSFLGVRHGGRRVVFSAAHSSLVFPCASKGRVRGQGEVLPPYFVLLLGHDENPGFTDIFPRYEVEYQIIQAMQEGNAWYLQIDVDIMQGGVRRNVKALSQVGRRQHF